MDHRRGRHGAPTLGAVPAVRRGAVSLIAGLFAGRWHVERAGGPARELFEVAWPDPLVPTVRFLDATEPAVVIGSAQPLLSVDSDADAGVSIVRRHSGGGAVLLRPGEVLWADVYLPAGDQLWDDDVRRSVYWLGRTWTLALGDLGIDASCHEGGLIASQWSHLACFAGLGPGEVTVGTRKVIGISQRRTRAGALFQCAGLLRWDPGALTKLLALDAAARREVSRQLEDAAAALDVNYAELESAFLTRLAER